MWQLPLTVAALLVLSGVHANKVLLSDVRVLTLRSGAYTTGRRSAPSNLEIELLVVSD
jgi:hypothetical protein